MGCQAKHEVRRLLRVLTDVPATDSGTDLFGAVPSKVRFMSHCRDELRKGSSSLATHMTVTAMTFFLYLAKLYS